MKTRNLIITGVIVCFIIAVSAIGIQEYQSTYNQNCVSKGGKVIGFLNCFKIREDFSGPKIEGKFAEEICSVVGDDCLPYYRGNFQEDGSIMVGITSWDADTKSGKSFVFIIKNDTLSYTVRENEN